MVPKHRFAQKCENLTNQPELLSTAFYFQAQAQHGNIQR